MPGLAGQIPNYRGVKIVTGARRRTRLLIRHSFDTLKSRGLAPNTSSSVCDSLARCLHTHDAPFGRTAFQTKSVRFAVEACVRKAQHRCAVERVSSIPLSAVYVQLRCSKTMRHAKCFRPSFTRGAQPPVQPKDVIRSASASWRYFITLGQQCRRIGHRWRGDRACVHAVSPQKRPKSKAGCRN
jgi:hypothetical protein